MRRYFFQMIYFIHLFFLIFVQKGYGVMMVDVLLAYWSLFGSHIYFFIIMTFIFVYKGYGVMMLNAFGCWLFYNMFYNICSEWLVGYGAGCV